MNKSKNPTGQIAGMLGMARRAGRLTTGFDAVAALITAGKAKGIYAAADLSEKTIKELRYTAKGNPLPLFALPLTKEEIGHALGLRKPVGVAALEDEGFAASMERLCRLCSDSQTEQPHNFEEECTR